MNEQDIIISHIKEYVANYSKYDVKNYPYINDNSNGSNSPWGEPEVAFASAKDEKFQDLKKIVGPHHLLPKDFLEDAKTVITYFIPFDKQIVKSNVRTPEAIEPSNLWYQLTNDTNNLINDLNDSLIKKIQELGGEGTSFPPSSPKFEKENLTSDWSIRHVAHIAGLGTFGLNNMLITDKGCCGRFGSIVTNLAIEPSNKENKQVENCLYKYNGTCKKCVIKCPNDSFYYKDDSYFCDAEKCYNQILEKNKKDACGKCMSGVPCSFINPVSNLRKD
ncbi:(Fe-S)-binding protein [Natranaerobius trueperi]|uniref:(Fe-S)-binding protein n=2 Tax=Natranaerobius trueperi TaxID=759412 RepID=A0A226C347_9FIRM|nr:(Fe-S)-binding protein [Natranaerobius trueperi]